MRKSKRRKKGKEKHVHKNKYERFSKADETRRRLLEGPGVTDTSPRSKMPPIIVNSGANYSSERDTDYMPYYPPYRPTN